MKATGIVRRIDDLGSVVGTSAPIFTIEIKAIVKFYDQIYVCF